MLQKGEVTMKKLKKDECEMIADEIIIKLHKVCNQNKIPIETLISIGVNILTDTIENG